MSFAQRGGDGIGSRARTGSGFDVDLFGRGGQAASRAIAAVINLGAAGGVEKPQAVLAAMPRAPGEQRVHRGPQVASGVGEFIIMARCVAGVGTADEDAALDEGAEAIGEHRLGDV